MTKAKDRSPPKLFGKVRWERMDWGWRTVVGDIAMDLLENPFKEKGPNWWPQYNVRGGCPLESGPLGFKAEGVRWLEAKFKAQLKTLLDESGLTEDQL